jgi:large subunit ribosomal protein L9
MKVILLEDIKSLGKLGDVVEVRPGYGRNYLFPQGKAERAGKEEMERFEGRREELVARQKANEDERAAVRDALDGYLLQLGALASVDGNLYGSVTPQIIADALNRQGVVKSLHIRRGQVVIAENQIKSLGEHPVTVNIGPDLVANITVTVLAEAAGNNPTGTGGNKKKEKKSMSNKDGQ